MLVLEKSSGIRQTFLNHSIKLYQKDDVSFPDQKRWINVSEVSRQRYN